MINKTVGETVEETVGEIILNLIQLDATVTTNDMIIATGLTRRGVEYNVNKLKKAGIINRSGSTKSGRWVINVNQ